MLCDIEKYTSWGKGLQGPTVTELHDILYLLERNMNSPLANSSILDIGCGTGSFSIPLASLGTRVLGLDVHPGSIETAKKNCPFANARFEVADANDIKVSENFDAVICISVVEHLKEPARLLRRLPSLLKKDGIALIVVPNGYGPFEIIEPFLRILLMNRKVAGFLRILAKVFFGYKTRKEHVSAMLNPDSPHVHRLTYHGIIKLLQRNGMAVRCIRASNMISCLLPFSLIMRKTRWLERFDACVARLIPLIASGWHIACETKQGYDTGYVSQPRVE